MTIKGKIGSVSFEAWVYKAPGTKMAAWKLQICSTTGIISSVLLSSYGKAEAGLFTFLTALNAQLDQEADGVEGT